MMNMAVKLKAAKRESLKKSANKVVRLSGQVPAVVYGKNKESKNVAVDSVELLKTVRDEGRNAIISLDIENDSSVDVMLHEYQMDPIKDELIHVDFYVVNMSQEMDVAVAIRLDGEAPGSKEGGVLQQPLYEIQVRAKPGDIPEEIAVDVSSLGLGEGLTVGDLKVTGNFEILEDPETTVVTIVAPDTVEDIEQASDEDAEPEVVGSEKKESEEA